MSKVPDEFAGLPDDRRSLRGVDRVDGRTTFFTKSIARKLYRCPRCKELIEIGSDHVIVQRIETGTFRNHHHWHRPCAERLLRQHKNLEAIDRAETSRAKMTKRSRRKRYQSRRR